MTLYYVNPTNTSDIRTTDLDGKIIAVNARVRLPINGGAQSRQWQVIGPVEQWDVYDSARADQGAPDQYYTSFVSLALEGPIQTPGTIVRETVNYTSFTNQEIHDLRVQEVEAIRAQTLLQGVNVDIADATGARLKTTVDMQLYYQNIDANSLPGATEYTVPGLDLGTFYRLRKNETDLVLTQISTFLQAPTEANDATKQSDLAALLAADDRQGLVDYDVTTGWPAPPT